MEGGHPDSCGARDTLEVGGRALEIFRLGALADRFDIARLPFSLKVLLENLLRTEDGEAVTPEDIEALAGWDPAGPPTIEIAFTPDRRAASRLGHHHRAGAAVRRGRHATAPRPRKRRPVPPALARGPRLRRRDPPSVAHRPGGPRPRRAQPAAGRPSAGGARLAPRAHPSTRRPHLHRVRPPRDRERRRFGRPGTPVGDPRSPTILGLRAEAQIGSLPRP
jgi:hypothetical protein